VGYRPSLKEVGISLMFMLPVIMIGNYEGNGGPLEDFKDKGQ